MPTIGVHNSGVPRPLGRDTAATIKHYPRLLSMIPIAPSIRMGTIPRKSPPIWNFDNPRFRVQYTGTCVGQNTTAVRECMERIPGGAAGDSTPLPAVNLSPLWTYYISRQRCASDGINLQGEGSIVSEAMLAMKDYGVCHWDLWPNTQQNEVSYSDSNSPPAGCRDEGVKHRVTDAAVIDTWEKLLTFVGMGYPISFGVPIYESIQQTAPDGRFDLFRGNILGGHCMRILGFDMDADWVKIGNSWAHWGAQSNDSVYSSMDGFTNIGYTSLTDFQRYFNSSSLSSGETEAVVLSKNERFSSDTPPLIYSYASLFA